MTESRLHPDRFFSSDPIQRQIAAELYQEVRDLPIVSPHGHTDPEWFATNAAFANPAALLIQPDHYLLRMLYSQGIDLAALGLSDATATSEKALSVDPQQVWQVFADHYSLFLGTPTRCWMDYVLVEVFGIEEPLQAQSAQRIYTQIDDLLRSPAYRPRSLFERFNIEALATTESPLDRLQWHQQLQAGSWNGRVITAFRPDPVVDPEYEGFAGNLEQLAALTQCDTGTYGGYLDALRNRRQFFITMGATSTDHGHPSAVTADLDQGTCERLYQGALAGSLSAAEAELFRGQMLLEMALMSLDDGLVMQIHPGVYRNHNPSLMARFGRDKGADLPLPGEFIHALKPLLDRVGNAADFSLIVFTLDETSYSRELAPLAGHYPALKLGPAWWFHDSPEGMLRYRQQVTETAGFYNTVGFNDDTRAFLSIPARHDLARRIDCRFLAQWVAEHRLSMDEAGDVIVDLSGRLAREAYKL